MSGLAGIIRLSATAEADEQQLRTMLSALAIGDGCSIETCCHPQKGIFVGRVSYGPCARPSPPTGPDGLRAFVAGEFLNDDAAGLPSFDAYLLERYRAAGWPHFAKGLNGAFAAVLVDPAQGRVVLLTDHLESCPLHVTRHQGCFYFATEVKAILALAHLPCRPEVPSVLSTLTNEQLINGLTIVEGIRRLPYSTACRIQDGVVQEERIWRFLLQDGAPDRGLEQHLADLREVLHAATARAVRFGPTGLLLSGGYDSRTILAFMQNRGALLAVTYTAREKEHPAGDAAVARRVAALFDLPHCLVRHDGGQILEAIRQSIFDSDGAGVMYEGFWDQIHRDLGLQYMLIGDECFGRTSGGVRRSDMLDFVGIHPLEDWPVFWPLLLPKRLEEFWHVSREQCGRLAAEFSHGDLRNRIDEMWHVQGLVQWFSPKRRAIIRHGLHMRRPLLDLQVLDLVRTIPARYRMSKALARTALRREAPQVFKIPFAHYREDVDFQPHFAALESQGGQVSRYLFEDNPLMEEFFDLTALRRLVAGVTGPQARPRRNWKARLMDLTPPRWRAWLAARARRLLGLRAPALRRESDLLLRVLITAAILRHLHCRGQGAPAGKAWRDLSGRTSPGG